MRFWSVASLVGSALLILVTAGPSSHAENDDVLRYPGARAPTYGAQGYGAPPPRRQRQQTYRPAPQQPARGPYAPSPYAAPSGGSFFGGLFTPPQQPAVQPSPYANPYAQPSYGRVDPAYDPRRDPRYVPQGPRYGVRPAPERRTARRRPPPVVAAQPAPAEPKKQEAKVEITTRIAVFGDSVADLLADGLSEAFEDAAEIEIISEAKANSGLARPETQDWPKAAREFLAANEKLTVGVMMVGVNDRQPIREGDQAHEPLSDRWRQIYGERVDAVAAAFVEKKLPLIWIGAPPVRNERQSADIIAINEIIRDRVQRAGGTYLDIWPGFVDEENRYTASGPDHRGQTARLRTSDGVHFTRAGARTAAEFVVTEIKRILDRRKPDAPAVAGTSDPKVEQAAIDRIIDGAVQLPASPDLGAPLPSRPLAGPVLPLTRPDVAPGGVLLASRPALDADAAGLNKRALEVGITPGPRPGRADDFRWPRP